jgi:TIR domain-containing protein
MTSPAAPDIFLSYSRRNRDIMERVVTWLRARGFKVWVDNERLTPGTPIWEAEIESAIASARAAVVLLSPEAKKSQWVRAEIEYAKKNNKRVYPVLIAGDVLSSVPLGLLSHQFVDLQKDEERGLEELGRALSSYLAMPSGQAEPGEEDAQAEEEPALQENADLEEQAGVPVPRPGPGRGTALAWIVAVTAACVLGLCGVGAVWVFAHLPASPDPTLTPYVTAVPTAAVSTEPATDVPFDLTAEPATPAPSALPEEGQLIFGPEEGSLVHDADDETIAIYPASVDLRDFMVEATFWNPYSTSIGTWDYGVLFRDEYGNNQFRLMIFSDQTWRLENVTDTTDVIIQEGQLLGLDTSESGLNTVTLYSQGDGGALYVNGEYIAPLDLSARQNSGDIRIGTGFQSGNEINGYSTYYQGFRVLESVPVPDPPPTPSYPPNAANIVLRVVTGFDGTNDQPVLKLYGDTGEVFQFVMDTDPSALQPNQTDEYSFRIPGTFCDVRGFEITKPAGDSGEDAWDLREVYVFVDDILVFGDLSVAETFGPITATSFPPNGNWEETEPYLQQCR